MKFLHLSDLHIGKNLYGYSLLDDQEAVLSQILAIVRERKPDAVLLCGDIYDKSVPSAEAVAVFDRFLGSLAALEPAPCLLLISGNHDSAQRLSFASSILEKQNVYLQGSLIGGGADAEGQTSHIRKITLADAWGPVNFYLLPYTRPADVRAIWPDERIETYQEAISLLLDREPIDGAQRNVLLSHQFYVSGGGGPLRSDSEQITVGGMDQIDTVCLKPFVYAALGHIHRPQAIGRPQYRYCGTPLKYSVSEWNQEKSVTLVTLGEPGAEAGIEVLLLKAPHEVRLIRGKLEEILAAAGEHGSEDYVSVTLTDEQDPWQPRERLEAVFPRLLEIRMDRGRMQEMPEEERMEDETDPEILFSGFFQMMQGRGMSREEEALFHEVVRGIREEQK